MVATYLDHVSWALGDRATDVTETAAAGDLWSAPETFVESGFRTHHRCAPGTDAYQLALRAVAPIRSATRGVDALVYSTSLPCNANLGAAAAFRASGDVKHLADFPASHMQADLGLDDAYVIGIAQQACTGLLGALRTARALVIAEDEIERVLCVTADRFPEGARYEQSYNLVSDLAAAAIVSSEPCGWRIVACHGKSNGALARAEDDQIVGAYFGYAHRTIVELCERAGIAPSELDWVVPQNMNDKAWRILSGLLGLPLERVAMPTLADVGHGISGDNFVNLASLEASGRVQSGHRALLFMAGLGLHWQAILLEKV